MTALIGDFEIGVQPLWPPAELGLPDFFDRPSWERPTDDRPYDPPVPVGGDDPFPGSPGFGGPGNSPPSMGTPGFDPTTLQTLIYTPGTGGTGGTITQVMSDGTTISILITSNRTRVYRIEVYDGDGDKICGVPGWTSGKLTRKLDHASTLEFSIPWDGEGAADLVRPNVVWLRDQWGFVIETFQIQRRCLRGSGDSSFIDVTCQGAIGQLGEEIVIQYAQDVATTTVIEHVEALLALQVKDAPMTLGEIDDEIAEIELPFFAMDTTIHAALLQIQMALPKEFRGRMYVDPQRRFQWRVAPGDDGAQVITRKRNVRGIESEIDYTALVNEIWMYGDGQDPATRLKLSDLEGHEDDYLQDTVSVSTYGVHPAIKVDRRIRYPETLHRVAERILEEFAEPPVVVRVDVLDLAKADDAPGGWENIEIGGQYRVVDLVLGIDQVVEIVGIETDLTRPVPIRVELANQTRSLGDLISGLVDALQQPIDVDGERYPTMGRNYTDHEPRNPRAGDTRWNTDRGQMYDGTEWRDMGGGEGGDPIWYEAATKAELPDPATVAATALGRVTSGALAGMVCVVSPDGESWDAINFLEITEIPD